MVDFFFSHKNRPSLQFTRASISFLEGDEKVSADSDCYSRKSFSTVRSFAIICFLGVLYFVSHLKLAMTSVILFKAKTSRFFTDWSTYYVRRFRIDNCTSTREGWAFCTPPVKGVVIPNAELSGKIPALREAFRYLDVPRRKMLSSASSFFKVK